ncbi:hypothetical protein KI387_001101, partial [Taxus chinensis]
TPRHVFDVPCCSAPETRFSLRRDLEPLRHAPLVSSFGGLPTHFSFVGFGRNPDMFSFVVRPTRFPDCIRVRFFGLRDMFRRHDFPLCCSAFCPGASGFFNPSAMPLRPVPPACPPDSSASAGFRNLPLIPSTLKPAF